MNLLNITYKLKFFIKESQFIIQKLLQSSISKLRLITVSSMLLKTILFLTILHNTKISRKEALYTSIKFSFTYLGFILFIYAFGYLFSKNKQSIFYILLNFLHGILLTADLWYFRSNADFIGIKNILFSGTFNPTGLSLINFRMIDIFFLIDMPFIIGTITIKKINNSYDKNVYNFIFTLKTSLILILLSILFCDILNLSNYGNSIIYRQWSTLLSVQAPGPLGYHVVEAYKSISKSLTTLNNDDKNKIEQWIANNDENLEPNEYFGIFKGKNIIFLQIESMENFVINRTANGKEITPFINKLIKNSLYFNNFYEQNNGANSIDCDFMINTSIYPLGDQITATNYGENVYPNSLPRILNSQGYITISNHPEYHGEFNWTELHKNGFGAQELWSINDYNYDEVVGYGLSDRSLFTQLTQKLKDVKGLFFLQVPTLSSHGPFDIDKSYRELDLPEEIDKSYLGGYFESLHYTDTQLEILFNKLKDINLLNNSVIVIYGDHTGVHKYYNQDIQGLNFEGDWWKEYDHKIPLIIYSPNTSAETITASGGQVDMLPTLSYLLGIDKSLYKDTAMGRVLVNTNRDSTIIKGNIINGNIKSSEEEKHLLEAYDIGQKIIKNNYFTNIQHK
jgi:lipoteichoic acid synthase